MGVIRTDRWMEEDFGRPEVFCKNIKQAGKDVKDFYRYLQSFGMYRPSGQSKQTFLSLKEKNAWEKIAALKAKYQKLWKGPDPDIYIFPIRAGNGFGFRKSRGKSGVTLPDAVFLFLGPVRDEKEWEALLIHEYHHAARMSRLKRPLMEYTLLDSLVFEGLAEHAVLEYLGEEYISGTSRLYTGRQKMQAWHRFFAETLERKKSEKIHDDLLFGRRYVPNMMGYALGYFLIEEFKNTHAFSTAKCIGLASETFLTKNFK